MKSCVSVTYQIDDIETAAAELLDKALENLTPLKNNVGILFCYSDMDVEALAEAMSKRANFDVVGCTCIANMDRSDGFHSMAATLTLLSSDTVSFATAVSEAITPQNIAEQVAHTYKAACDKLGAAPKLLFALPPYILEIMLDAYSNAFNENAPGVPVIGGLPSFNAQGDSNLTILNGVAYTDRMVLLAMAGDIQPVFSVRNVTSNDAEKKRKITHAENNVVYKVGDQLFTDYLREIGLPVEKLAQGNATITFVSNPLLIENNPESGEAAFSFARTLHEIDLSNGSGTAIGEIPCGATLSVCSLQRDEIERAATSGIQDLKQKMQAHAPYQYSTVLAVSCIGRHLLMLPNNDAEVRQLLAEFPEQAVLTGFYSYGELGPQGDQQHKNFAHNESLILCAF